MFGHHPCILSRIAYLKKLIEEAETDVHRGDIYYDALERIKTTADELIDFKAGSFDKLEKTIDITD